MGEIDWLWTFAVASAGFAAMAVAVATGLTDRIDEHIMRRLERPARPELVKPGRFETVIRDISALGGDTARALFLVGCAGGWVAAGNNTAAIRFVAIGLSARMFVWILKRLIDRQRPPETHHGVPTYTTSFPSGHTLLATSMLLAAVALLTVETAPALRLYALAAAATLSVLIGLARIHLRVHWPSDVVAGWLAGVAWTAGSLLLIDLMAL